MALQVSKSTAPLKEPKLNVLIYGAPGTGKTTWATKNAGKVLVGDCENGSVFLGLQGIEADIAQLSTWDDLPEFYKLAKDGGYDTVVLDPVGELLDKLLKSLKTKYGANGGDTLSIGGWGVAKDKFKEMIRAFRDLHINLVLVAHTSEKKDEEGIVIRPKLQANLDEDVCAMMQVVGYLKAVTVEKTRLRRLYLRPSDKFYAKDRVGLLPEFLDNSDFGTIRELISGNETLKKHLAHIEAVDTFLPETNVLSQPTTGASTPTGGVAGA